MKVLMINGSPRSGGNTAVALKEMEQVFARNEIETTTMQIGSVPIRGCVACGGCATLGRCVLGEDPVNEASSLFRESDGLVIATPVYYGSANGTLISFLDRLFQCSRFDKRMKVGASVAVARRGGTTATFDELNKYFTITGMPVASSQYWNNLHGGAPGEALQDAEGLQIMRTLAENMSFLIKSIALGRKTFGLPDPEPRITTSFIR